MQQRNTEQNSGKNHGFPVGCKFLILCDAAGGAPDHCKQNTQNACQIRKAYHIGKCDQSVVDQHCQLIGCHLGEIAHAGIYHLCLTEVFCPEQNPQGIYNQEGNADPQHPGDPVQPLAEETFRHHEKTVQHTPQNKGPGSAVPQAADQKGQKQIQISTDSTLAVSTQRAVDIGAQRPAEGDVPPAPEYGNALRAVRRPEILGDIDVEHLSQTNGHVRIAAEIKINLEGIGERGCPCGTETKTFGVEAIFYKQCQRIGDHDFLEKTDAEHIDAPGEIVSIECPAAEILELGDHFTVQHNGTRYQLGEEQDKNAVIPKGFQGCFLVPNRDQEGQLLESEETDAQRKDDVLQMEGRGEYRIDIGDKEIVVLEVAQQTHVEQNAQYIQDSAALSGKPHGNQIVYKDGSDDDEQITDVIIAVEKQGGKDQKQPLEKRIFQLAQTKISQQNHWQECKNENIG